MSKDLSADICRLTPGSLESSLASDDMLTHYFNGFLRLPCFPEAVMYNQTTGLFEVMSGEAQNVFDRIRTALNRCRSALRTGDPTTLAKIPLVDNQYTLCCLHKEEGVLWITRERLPFFLQSDFYHEYRLSKLLLQWNPKFAFSQEGTSSRATPLNPQPFSSFFEENRNSQQVQMCPQEPISAENADLYPLQYNSGGNEGAHNSETELHISFSRPSAQEEEQHREMCPDQTLDRCEAQLQELAAKASKEVLEPAMNVITQTQANTSESSSLPGDQTNYGRTENPRECHVYQVSEKANRGRLVGRNKTHQDVSDRAGKTGWDGVCYYGDWISLDDFREFIQGTPGEKLTNLWMDIEKVQAIQNSGRKSRHLVLMRSWYLSKNGPSNLSEELLSRLGLNTAPCWTEERLHSVQPYLSESLLHYWAPRFWTSPLFQQPIDDTLLLGISPSSWHPYSDSGTQDVTQTSNGRHSQLQSSRGEMRSIRRKEEMLQVLCGDSRGGSYFTHFCEQSGNQLWVDAVYFWTDLQHYRALFYQDGLDLYAIQRDAQLLYFTYISCCAGRSLGVEEVVQRKVHDGLQPAFEELFDEVEEHALNILLESWALLVDRETESFQQVCAQQEVRRVDSQDYQDLQSLYEESVRQQNQVQQSQSMLFHSSITSPSSLKSPSASASWSSLSPEYHGSLLASLLRHNQEIEHFRSFLQTQDASIHLECWLDLEQYKGTPLRDETIRQELFTSMTRKYLNNTYFFGPHSPATTEQQKDIVLLAGGLEHLKKDRLSNLVAIEIRDIVKAHLEKTWLPLFVSTPEFTERQKHKPKQLLAADRPSHYVHRRRRRRGEAWRKVESLWMSSSKEIVLLRQALLHPLTCEQFQHFVSLKGSFLVNDLLFWLEVQRYKDLCHSHSNDATIQQKISTIISCFINSSTPPALQIHIPQHQAQLILEKRHQLGPYIFRQAQISVFGELLRLWPEFQEFRSSMEEKQLLPVLQDKSLKHRARVRRRRRKEEEEEEERRVQELLKGEESGREEDETKEKDTVESQERGGERAQLRTQSRVQPLLWSYSKYMAGLKREEVLLKSQLETSSTLSASSHDCSVKSAFSKLSNRQSSRCSSRSKGNRTNNSGRASNKV